MSKRRQAGDWVWMRTYAGFVQSEKPQRGQIRPESYGAQWCMLDCGDPDCREWLDVWRADGVGLCHVSECEMFDSEEEAQEQSAGLADLPARRG
jgi:hypothetical protein